MRARSAVGLLLVCLCPGVLASCGGDDRRADQWLDALDLDGAQVVKVDHPRGVDAAEATLSFDEPTAVDDIAATIGTPPGYRVVPPDERGRDARRQATEVAGVIVPAGDPSAGCTIAIWGLEEVGDEPTYSGVWLDIGCGAAP